MLVQERKQYDLIAKRYHMLVQERKQYDLVANLQNSEETYSRFKIYSIYPNHSLKGNMIYI